MGIRRLVSYTRADEAGTCYRAAGWVATAVTGPREWTTGSQAGRWLPGLYVPSTEIVDRVRWEIGPDAATTRVRRAGGGWETVPESAPVLVEAIAAIVDARADAAKGAA